MGRWQVEGAHCTGQNVVALGIENEGTYSAVNPPAELWNKLRSLCAYLCAQYGIRPSQIYGHRDFKDTACPGDRLYAALPRLRSEVAGLLGQRLTKATVSEAAWPLLRIADRGERVLAAQHLLRAAGVPGVVPDGRFTRELADTVRAFQDEHGFGRDDPGRDEADGPTGMIGGETLAGPGPPGARRGGRRGPAGRRGPPARPGRAPPRRRHPGDLAAPAHQVGAPPPASRHVRPRESATFRRARVVQRTPSLCRVVWRA